MHRRQYLHFQEGKTPHVARLNRDILITSESPDNPGHLMIMKGAKVHIQDCEFADFGRTTIDRADVTTFFPDGSVDHVAENRQARYAVHCHLMSDTGSEVSIVNNVVRDPRRWGIAIHGTNRARVVDNVVVGAEGAGIVSEDSTCHSNRFIGNLEVDIISSRRDDKIGGFSKAVKNSPHLPADLGYLGSGIWANGRGDFIDDNVAVNCSQHGTTFTGYSVQGWREFGTTLNGSPALNRNEAYACGVHTWSVHPQGSPPGGNKWQDVHNGMVGWHLMIAGCEMHHTDDTVIQDAVFHNDPKVSEQAPGSRTIPDSQVGVAFDFGSKNYRNGGILINNPTVTGWNIGVHVPVVCLPENWFRVDGGVLKNFLNVLLTPARKADREATFTDVDFQLSDIKPLATLVRFYDEYPDIPRHAYDVFGAEVPFTFADDPAKSQIGKSSLVLINDGLKRTVFIDGDLDATCTDRDEKIYGFVCEAK